MIVYGTRDVALDLEGAPTVDISNRDAVEYSGGEILQVLSELTFSGFEARVPPALHPTHPPFCSMVFYVVPDSEHGPFSIAMVRVSSLAGISRFGYAVKGWTNNAAVARDLGSRFGYRLEPASIRLERGYDRITASVDVDDSLMLEVGLADPDPVSGKDANHAGHLNVAYVVDEAGESRPTLIQSGPQLAFTSCDRGKPFVNAFDATAIGCDAPYWPISAFSGSCDFRFEPVQFVCDPDQPAVDRSMRLAGTMHSVG